jgi:hypothetical protein
MQTVLNFQQLLILDRKNKYYKLSAPINKIADRLILSFHFIDYFQLIIWRQTETTWGLIFNVRFTSNADNSYVFQIIYCQINCFIWCAALSNDLSRDIGFFGLLHKMKDWTLFYIVTNFHMFEWQKLKLN